MRRLPYFVYVIFNHSNRRSYSGCTYGNFMQRLQHHTRALIRNVHYNKELQKDFNSGHRFTFSIVKTTFIEKEAKASESDYMFSNSYNIYGNPKNTKRPLGRKISICTFMNVNGFMQYEIAQISNWKPIKREETFKEKFAA